jgi:acetyl-CoA C-acetyltransferase
MSEFVITAAKRTAIGGFQGTLKDSSAVDLGVVATKAILAGLPAEDIADVIVGNVLQAGNGMNAARQIALKSGLPDQVTAQTINRVCGSGLQAVVSAVQGLQCGDGKIYLAGGTENMSRAPYLLPQARAGYRYGTGELVDSILSEGLTDSRLRDGSYSGEYCRAMRNHPRGAGCFCIREPDTRSQDIEGWSLQFGNCSGSH